MVKQCSECGEWCSRDEFSYNQWFNRDYPKCESCVLELTHPYCCDVCDMRFTGMRKLNEHMDEHPYCDICERYFRHANNLKQHMKVHRPRKVACPACGEQRFASGANAVAHVETGACSACRGKSRARKVIFEYVSQNAPQLQVPRITNCDGDYDDDDDDDDDVPEYPYYCYQCQRSFKHLSALMNHEEDYHNTRMRLRRLTC